VKEKTTYISDLPKHLPS